MRLVLHTAIFTIVAPGTLTAAVPALIVWLTGASLAGAPAAAAAFVVLAAGITIFLRCVFDFIMSGRGTPDPNRPPSQLVTRGLFRFVRNPMYVGVITVLAGEALLFLSPLLLLWAALVTLAFHLRVVVYEEPTLARTFGPAWEDYRRRVPRWLPRLPPP